MEDLEEKREDEDYDQKRRGLIYSCFNQPVKNLETLYNKLNLPMAHYIIFNDKLIQLIHSGIKYIFPAATIL